MDVTFERDGEDGSLLCHTFTVQDTFCTIRITLGVDTHINEKTWENFLNCVKNKTKSNIEYCGSNGEVSVNFDGEYITFVTSKYGQSGSGDINVKMPFEKCINAFEKVVESLRK